MRCRTSARAAACARASTGPRRAARFVRGDARRHPSHADSRLLGTSHSRRRSRGYGTLEEVDDLGGRRARPEDLGYALLLQLVRVVLGTRPAEDDEHVLGPVLAQQVEDAW